MNHENLSNRSLLSSSNYVKKKDIQRILVISDLHNFIHFNKLHGVFIDHLYTVLYLLINVFRNAVIEINDRSGIKYNKLWKPGSSLFNSTLIDDRVSNRSLEEINFREYDLIVCHPFQEEQLQKVIGEQVKRYKEKEVPGPQIVSLSSRKYQEGIYPPVCFLFKNEEGKSIIDTQTDIMRNKLRKDIVTYFKGLEKENCEDIYSHIIEKIQQVNKKSIPGKIQRILVLDDHYRRFFLGDAYLYFLCNTKQTIHSISTTATCTVNCSNKNIYCVLSEMFKGSFGEKITFSNVEWEELDFSRYDLILCHPDSILKLLAFLNNNPSFLFWNTAVYYYNHMIDPKNVIDRYGWNYKVLLREKGITTGLPYNYNFFDFSDKEIFISKQERSWADNWFVENGLQEEEHIFILIDSASVSDKLLHPRVYIQMVKWVLSMPHTRVLLFDERKTGKKEKITGLISKADRNRILVAENLTIRETMKLLSSKYVKAIIGPCTGLLHLANGIYTYLKKNNFVRKNDFPILLVYTGNLNILNPGYHPKHWWIGSFVTCAILSIDSNGRKIVKKLGQCPGELQEYIRTTLPVDQFTPELLIDFITNNFSYFRKGQQGIRSLPLPA